MEEDNLKALPIAKDLATRFSENPRYKYLEGLCYLLSGQEEEFGEAVGGLCARVVATAVGIATEIMEA